MTKPRDINELREELLDALALVKKDPDTVNQVREIINASGKVINLVRAQLQYAMLKGEEPDIPYLGKTSGKPLKSSARLLVQ